jgi:glycosyltransferase involved in cell wall biosynthesis
MKVLMQNRPENLWQGGDMVQLRKTQAALGRLGVETDFNDKPVHPVPLIFRMYDVIHNFNFSMSWSRYQTWVAKKHKKPLVFSMIYHEGEQFIPYSDQQIMADATDAMIFLTKGEIERAKRHLKIDDAKCHVIPNGVDPFWFKPVGGDSGLPPFALTVGRIEPSKGQLEVAEACRSLGMKYVCIGQRTDEAYAQSCESAGAALFPAMESKDLIKFYGQCAVFVLASSAEVQPLSVMEAMAQGAPVVLTHRCEWETFNVVRCHPHDAKSIEAAIQVALLRGKNVAGIEEMKAMTWDAVALKLKPIYESLCVTS